MLSFSNIFANIAFALGLYTVVTNYQKNIKKRGDTWCCARKSVNLHFEINSIIDNEQI